MTMRKQHEQAIALYREGYETDRSLLLMRRLASAYAAAGRPADATATLANWLESHPDDKTVRGQLASYLQGSGEDAKAIEQYEKLLGSDGIDAVALNNLAWLYFTRDDARALATAEKAVQLAPDRAEIVDTLAWILINADQAKRAVPMLESAILRNPDNLEIAYHLAAGFDALGEKEKAREVLEKLLEGNKAFSSMDDARKLLENL